MVASFRSIVTHSWGRWGLAILSLVVLFGGCMAPDLTLNAIISSFSTLGRPPGSDTNDPGTRGNISVKFVNNTSYRAIFTYGTYDPLNIDQDSPTAFPPLFQQFFVGGDEDHELLARSESAVFTFTRPGDAGGCGRGFGLGNEQFVELIAQLSVDEGLDSAADGEDLHGEALWPACLNGEAHAGVAFYPETSAGPNPGIDTCGGVDDVVAFAEPVLTWQGAEYPCNSTLVYTFTEDGIWEGDEGEWKEGLVKVSVTLTVLDPLEADAGPDKEIVLEDSAILEGSATGGVPPYTYAWSPTGDLDDPTIAEPEATPSSTTTYTLTVTDDAGHVETDTVKVTVELP